MTIIEILRNTAIKYPKKKALIFGKKKINYEKLYSFVNNLSIGLLDLGAGKSSKIGILLKNSPEFIISYFSILKSGSVVIPINYMLKEEEIKYILENSGCFAIISSLEFSPMLERIRLRLDSLKHIILVDENNQNTINFKELASKHKTAKSVSINEGDIASILYTSGTTGHPKGVILTHKNLCSNVKSCIEAIELKQKDKFLCILPMFHSFTLIACVLLPIYLGSAIFILDSIKSFKKIIKNILRNRITIFVAIPTIYNIISNASLPRGFILRLFRFLNPLRICISGAAALPVKVIEIFEDKFKVPLLEGYGLTEASPVVSINPLDSKRKPGSVGLPLPGINVRVIDDNKNTLFGEAGELLVKGDNVMKGYYNLDKASLKVLEDGWLYTGDIAKIDDEGYIYIIDRKKDLIIVRGQNVYPREVEEALYLSSHVAEACVVGIKDEHKGEVPKAFIALKEKNSIDEVGLIHFTREHIASYKVPKVIEFMDSLPKSSTGKILRRKLR